MVDGSLASIVEPDFHLPADRSDRANRTIKPDRHATKAVRSAIVPPLAELIASKPLLQPTRELSQQVRPRP